MAMTCRNLRGLGWGWDNRMSSSAQWVPWTAIWFPFTTVSFPSGAASKSGALPFSMSKNML